MDISVEELDHPTVHNVGSLEGVGKFYEAIGYSAVIPPGLEGLVLRLESKRRWPTMVFKLSNNPDQSLGDLTLYLKVSKPELNAIQETLHFTTYGIHDPNGITVKFY